MSGRSAAVVLALAAALLAPAPLSGPKGFDLAAFSRLPVLEGGRVKPLETLARSTLLMLSGKQTGATAWLLELAASPDKAQAKPVFLIDDPDLLGVMGQARGAQRRFSWNELLPFIEEFRAQAARAEALEGSKRGRFESASLALWDRLETYSRLRATLVPEGTTDFERELAAYGRPELAQPRFDGARRAFAARYAQLADAAFFRPVPAADGAWKSLGASLLETPGRPADAHVLAYARMTAAYARGDAAGFNAAANDEARRFDGAQPRLARATAWEALFDRAEPFYRGMIAYLAGFLLLLLSFAWKPQQCRRAAVLVLWAALTVHTAGLVARIWLQGRPPVTNLYSSAVFVGWAAALGGLLVERWERGGFGSLAASVLGFTTLIVAHHLSEGDTMEVMRAVLDSNFWLATHVVTITVGYGAMLVASALAHAYFALRRAKPEDAASGRKLAGAVYGVLCAGLFFSFLGTVLGGIWADQSWGRFWGWDPKENGALLIVLWNAVALHARWGGYLREDGVAAMAIGGGVVTALSWFGVNMLGVGLHSYGFTEHGALWLERFVIAELAVLALALTTRAGATETARP